MSFAACAAPPPPEAAPAETAARALAARLLPDRHDLFAFEWMAPTASGGDVFEVEGRDGHIVIRGPNGVSMPMGLKEVSRRLFEKYRDDLPRVPRTADPAR